MDEIKKQINDLQNELALFKSHTHNNVSSIRLKPQDFLGFPITVVADATVAPTYAVTTGQVIFQIDNKSGTAHWSLWTYLPNAHDGTNGWHTVALT